MGLLGRILGRPERRAWLGDALIRDHDPDAALTLRTPQAETLAVAASCLTLYERAFESAAVEGPLAFGAQMRGMIARRLIQTGNAVAFLDRVGGVSVHPAALYEVEGDTPDPAEWRYRVSRNGPTGEERTVLRPASGVLHWRVNADWLTPWQGRGAGELAASSIRLMVEQDRGLTEEAMRRLSSVAIILAMPPNPNNMTSFVRALSNPRKAAIMFADGAVPPTQATLMRTPPVADQHWAAVRNRVQEEVCAAYGVPPELVFSAPGGSRRESYRQWVNASVLPVARVIEEEIEVKTGERVRFMFDDLGSADLRVKANALATLIEKAGMAENEAKQRTGFNRR